MWDLDNNRVGATLRVDLPNREGGLRYARTVADYLAHDASAASVLFAVYTSEPQKPGQPKPHAATIAALTCALAERDMTIRDRLLCWARATVRTHGLASHSCRSSKVTFSGHAVGAVILQGADALSTDGLFGCRAFCSRFTSFYMACLLFPRSSMRSGGAADMTAGSAEAPSDAEIDPRLQGRS